MSGILTFGQRSMQKIKVNKSQVNCSCQSQQSELIGQIRVIRVRSVLVNIQQGDVCRWGNTADVASCVVDDIARADVDQVDVAFADVIRWHHHMVWRVTGACKVNRRVKWIPEILEARERSDEGCNLKFCRSANEEAIKATRVLIRRSGSQESEATRRRFSGDNWGAWKLFEWPDFWGLVAGGRGARLWCWFYQVKLGFAQIW